MALGRISNRLGSQHLMVVSVIAYGAFPLLIGLAPTIPSYMLGASIGGIGWGFLGGALANRLMERIPDDDRPAQMALFNLTLNPGHIGRIAVGTGFGWLDRLTDCYSDRRSPAPVLSLSLMALGITACCARLKPVGGRLRTLNQYSTCG